MQILFIRHADPDYENETITEKGWIEAEALADRLCREQIDHFYVSPLGRAQDTLSPTLKRLGREAKVYDWMQEFFQAKIDRPDRETKSISWDWLPQDWTTDDRYYHIDQWDQTEIMQGGGVHSYFREVTEGLDALLAGHGYRRKGRCYEVTEGNHEHIVIMCHFGVMCVMLAHLIGSTPMVLWHGLAAAPTSVTTVNTEERRKGIASFRIASYGDISHLYAKGEPASFSARFCECYEDDTRHD